MSSLRLPATMESLDRLRSFVMEKAEEWSMPLETAPVVDLVLEEVLVNVISYAYPSKKGDLELCCFLDDEGSFCLVIKDWGIAFNPLEREDPDTSCELSQRSVGGLGIYLIRKMTKGVEYERRGEENVLTIRFDMRRS